MHINVYMYTHTHTHTHTPSGRHQWGQTGDDAVHANDRACIICRTSMHVEGDYVGGNICDLGVC